MSSATPVRADNALPHQPSSFARESMFYSPAWMVAVGFAVRLLCIAVELSLNLYQVPWRLFEMANIGHSLALGHGFASPFGGSTGPTTWTAPVYPFVISLAFRIFGVNSIGAAFFLFTFNSAFSALT